jgi:hypothetical protein
MGFITKERRDAIAAEPLKLAADEPSGNQTTYALKAVERELDRILDENQLPPGGCTSTPPSTRLAGSGSKPNSTTPWRHWRSEKSWPHPMAADHLPGKETAYLQYAAITTETRSGPSSH